MLMSSHTATAILLIVIAINLIVFPANATIFFEDGSNRTVSELYTLTNSSPPTDSTIPAMFFYDPDCGSCLPAHEYLTTYLSDHPETNIEMVNLSGNQSADERLNDLLYSYHREWMNIPVMFIGPVGLEGTNEIIDHFEGTYGWYNGTCLPA